MKKNILISMYSLHIGGAERSLIGLLKSLDYSKVTVDLFLYRYEGELIDYIPAEVNVLQSIPEYTTLNRPIKDVIREGYIYLGFARLLAKLHAKLSNRGLKDEQGTYKLMQYIWKYSLPKLPKIKNTYDAAISFLGPHDFILDKVVADVKIGWIHTDYSTIVFPDMQLEKRMWSRLDYIVNVSQDCEASFLKMFPEFQHKTIVIENIISPSFVKEQAAEIVTDEMEHNETIKICSVGRFSKQKGFDLAVKACHQLIELGYDIKWYVIGYGSEEQNIQTLIEQYGLENEFILLGKKANPYPYIAACDIYCQPSRYEGKAVTVREAQILGKPVLITRFPTSYSQLQEGVDGQICELSIEGIRDGLIQLIHDVDERKQLIMNCLQSNYNNESEINKLLALIHTQPANMRLKELAI